eukprot:TRINITY_DN12301_c0_g1_i1.p1 TRINITY_DN12301_c0_g1~~TRINITY_DN12301_c0_g1_i1.p1  ORF type:complete len:418 (+),score=46.98 TRINITY_DN12301_c0_g1_i1:51-1304(+)
MHRRRKALAGPFIDVTTVKKGKPRYPQKQRPWTKKNENDDLTGDEKTARTIQLKDEEIRRTAAIICMQTHNRIWDARRNEPEQVKARRTTLNTSVKNYLNTLERSNEVGTRSLSQAMAMCSRVHDLPEALNIYNRIQQDLRDTHHDVLLATCHITMGDHKEAGSILQNLKTESVHPSFAMRLLSHTMLRRRLSHPAEHETLRNIAFEIGERFKLRGDEGVCRNLVHLAMGHEDALNLKKLTKLSGFDGVVGACAEAGVEELQKCKPYLEKGYLKKVGFEFYMGGLGAHPDTVDYSELQEAWTATRNIFKSTEAWMLTYFCDAALSHFLHDPESSEDVLLDMEKKFAVYITRILSLSPSELSKGTNRTDIAPRAWEYLMQAYSVTDQPNKADWLHRLAGGSAISTVYEQHRAAVKHII